MTKTYTAPRMTVVNAEPLCMIAGSGDSEDGNVGVGNGNGLGNGYDPNAGTLSLPHPTSVWDDEE
ncbi:MAG: hypothetical protein NC388_10225 [Clostridium sp.]|nr:hypothetical protein [Clostridium sp.]